MIPEELFNKPAKITHHTGKNEYGIEQTTEYFGKIEKRNKDTNELTLKVMHLEDQFKKTGNIKRINVKEEDLEISFAVTKRNMSGKLQLYYEKFI